ncbi:BON domain-containing protein [Hydrogenophaga taeniospiralis]|jgi:osmotically-inducible protein OsmY|uniref:BON domain-containing protein n=1 Tax=Hydrogenophaga taeniospiralis TaxID=65656 RepID=UPI001CFC20F1|nr:BON domain-containing protein [Hydrogenophaga taeniospiralis]MCB4362396.1 BON domain-containing protein [Hydrogenophaga taeniospiralis]
MNQTQQPRHSRLAATVLASVLLGATVSACAPLMMGGAAVGSALVATDRRTSGAQLDDQTIELRAANRLRDQMGTRARLDVTSYNRRVLLTGEVVSARDKELAGQVVGQVANVAGVVNELDVANSPTLRERTADTLLTGRVKAAMLDAKDLSANSFKVVTNRGTVFLMGRVTQREADRATEIVRNTSSVQRVVRVLEIISDEELSRLQPQSAPAK